MPRRSQEDESYRLKLREMQRAGLVPKSQKADKDTNKEGVTRRVLIGAGVVGAAGTGGFLIGAFRRDEDGKSVDAAPGPETRTAPRALSTGEIAVGYEDSPELGQHVAEIIRSYETPLAQLVVFLDENGAYINNPRFYLAHREIPQNVLEERRRAAAAASGISYVRGRSPESRFISLTERLQHYAEPVREELGGLSALNYVRAHALDGVGSELAFVRDDLARFIPALAAQETQYENNIRSRANAMGTFQFLQGTWDRYRPEGSVPRLGEDPPETPFVSLPAQVVACGRYLTAIYRHLRDPGPNGAAEALEGIKARFFGSDETTFMKYFMLPCIINSYNAGEGRMVNVIKWFHAQTEAGQSSAQPGTNYDVFDLMGHEAQRNTTDTTSGYEHHASEYFERICAFERIIATRFPVTTTASAATAQE